MIKRLSVSCIRHLLLLLLLVALAACGAGGSNNGNNAPATTAATSAPSAHGTAPTASDALLLTGIAYQSNVLDHGSVRPQQGDTSPDFSFTFEDGSTHKLSDLRGKRVLLNFWATWCPPCNAEMPDIQSAAVQFQNQDFVVLAVSQDLEVNAIAPFAQRLNLTIPLIADPSFEIGSRYGVRNLPMSFFINRDGTISSGVIGMVNRDTIQQRLEQMN